MYVRKHPQCCAHKGRSEEMVSGPGRVPYPYDGESMTEPIPITVYESADIRKMSFPYTIRRANTIVECE